MLHPLRTGGGSWQIRSLQSPQVDYGLRTEENGACLSRQFVSKLRGVDAPLWQSRARHKGKFCHKLAKAANAHDRARRAARPPGESSHRTSTAEKRPTG